MNFGPFWAKKWPDKAIDYGNRSAPCGIRTQSPGQGSALTRLGRGESQCTREPFGRLTETKADKRRQCIGIAQGAGRPPERGPQAGYKDVATAKHSRRAGRISAVVSSFVCAHARLRTTCPECGRSTLDRARSVGFSGDQLTPIKPPAKKRRAHPQSPTAGKLPVPKTIVASQPDVTGELDDRVFLPGAVASAIRWRWRGNLELQLKAISSEGHQLMLELGQARDSLCILAKLVSGADMDRRYFVDCWPLAETPRTVRPEVQAGERHDWDVSLTHRPKLAGVTTHLDRHIETVAPEGFDRIVGSRLSSQAFYQVNRLVSDARRAAVIFRPLRSGLCRVDVRTLKGTPRSPILSEHTVDLFSLDSFHCDDWPRITYPTWWDELAR